MIHQNANFLQYMIKDILDYSMYLNSQQVYPELEQFNIGDAVQEIINLVIVQAQEKQIKICKQFLSKSLETTQECMLYNDCFRFKQTLLVTLPRSDSSPPLFLRAWFFATCLVFRL